MSNLPRNWQLISSKIWWSIRQIQVEMLISRSITTSCEIAQTLQVAAFRWSHSIWHAFMDVEIFVPTHSNMNVYATSQALYDHTCYIWVWVQCKILFDNTLQIRFSKVWGKILGELSGAAHGVGHVTGTSVEHNKRDAWKWKARIMIRIFRACPVSPTNRQKVWRGKTRLHQGTLRERMGGGWVKKWTDSICQSVGWGRREGKHVFFSPFLTIIAHRPQWHQASKYIEEMSKSHRAYKAQTQLFWPGSQARLAYCWVTSIAVCSVL